MCNNFRVDEFRISNFVSAHIDGAYSLLVSIRCYQKSLVSQKDLSTSAAGSDNERFRMRISHCTFNRRLNL